MLVQLFGRKTLIGKLRYYFLERHYSQTIRYSLIALCVALTLASTLLFRGVIFFNLDFLPGLIPILAMAGLAAVVILYVHFTAAIPLIVVISTIMAEGIGTGTGTKITFTFITAWALVGIWVFKMLVVEKNVRLRASPANLPALIFVIVVVISLVWSSGFADPDTKHILDSKMMPRLMTAAVLIISPLTYMLFANNIKSTSTIRFIVWWFIVVGAAFMALRLVTGSVPNPFNDEGQFPTWVGAFAVGQMLLNKKLRPIVRLGLGGVAAGWFYITLGLGISWLSGWLPLAVAAAIILLFYSRPLFIIALLIGAVFIVSQWDAVEGIFSAESEESGESRVGAWQQALTVANDHLMFGTGPAGYAFYFQARLRGFYQLSHNNYVDIISQTGLVGFFFFVWFWLGVNWVSLRTYRLVPKGGFEHGLATTLLAANLSTLGVMMLGDWVTPFTYTQGLGGIDYTIWAWIWAGLSVAYYHICRERVHEVEKS